MMTILFSRILQTTGVMVALSSCALPRVLNQVGQTLASVTKSVAPAPEVRRAQAVGGEEIFRSPTQFNIPVASSSLDDTARFLAGLSGAERGPLAGLRQSSSWVEHQRKMDELWLNFSLKHGGPIQHWRNTEMVDLAGSNSLFYPFSGPDFLFADTFFPNAETLVLCGLEPCEPLPPLAQLQGQEMDNGLDGLVTSVSTAMQFSFFITKDMRRDLVSTRFRGVLPLILAFMSRTGHTVESLDLVRMDGAGVPVMVQSGIQAPGVMIRARGPLGQLKRVFYFKQDLSNESLNGNTPLIKFVNSLGSPPAFVKSASYLMHEASFSNIRSYLLSNCRAIVQDPSGIPYRNILASGLSLRLYGNYQGTLEMFSEHQQTDLIQAYREGRHGARPIDFGIGYMFDPNRTCLMVARRENPLAFW